MLYFICGTVRSGKSSFAENLANRLNMDRMLYIATMINTDSETKRRIETHRYNRRNKKFITIECPTNVNDVNVEKDDVVVLECLTTLCANELFQTNNHSSEIIDKIYNDIMILKDNCKDLIIVSNDLFSDAINYEGLTTTYLYILGNIHQKIAKKCDYAYEMIYSIPVLRKGV